MKDQDQRPGILPPLTPAQKRARASVELVMDAEGRTAIKLSEEKTEVAFIPMAAEGLYVTYTSPSVFRTRYPHSQHDPKSPRSLQGATVMAAARCFVVHSTFCGAEPRAVEALEQLVPITKHEKERIHEMSTKKPEPTTKTKPTKAKPEKTVSTTSKASAAKPAKSTSSKPDGERKPKPSVTFRELIIQGKLTDDQIFAEVQKRHPEVTEDKRSYVAWYRNDLRKKGENPPAQKKSMKEDKAA